MSVSAHDESLRQADDAKRKAWARKEIERLEARIDSIEQEMKRLDRTRNEYVVFVDLLDTSRRIMEAPVVDGE